LRGKAPTIHFSTGTNHLLADIRDAGSDLVSVDWRIRLADAWDVIGPGRGIQGNLDPAMLMAPWEVVEASARDILAQAGGRNGHIFNLGHGIMPQTDPDQLQRLAALVHEEAAW
jgi:uroporphyrinogen decarboxylase